MSFRWLYPIVLAFGWVAGVCAVDFVTDIEPILRANCVDCHGPDQQESQFRLDRRSNMLAGGNSGEPAVVPGKPEESFLLRLVRHKEPGLEMPPDGLLSQQEIERIEQWITEGATTPEHYGPAKAQPDLSHWAFQPITRAESEGAAESNGIDQFVCRRLKDNGLTHSPVAERRVLIRRLFLVMLGIPPTPEQVEAFVKDDRENAWEELVEQVLASPHYGERWATYWLDLVRFGETHGFEMNRERPTAWHYRDWVIQSLNTDKPYDRFVRQQIAGDALGADVATGFLVAGPVDQVKGQDPKLQQMQRMNELDDIINTTGTAFLGLTTGCARCHNHKFDPISQRDYYALQAVFAGVQHGDRPLPTAPQTKQQIAKLDAEIADLTDKLKKFAPSDSSAAIVIDESDTHMLEPPQGMVGKHGHTDADFGDSKYTWWKNMPGKELAIYRPNARGAYRIWLSWGAGFQTHSDDARYRIKSTSGTREIASVNQQLPASGIGEVDKVPRWSGFFDAGVHDLTPDDQIALIGGNNGTAITADVIVLLPESGESVQLANPIALQAGSSLHPVKRVAVNAKQNEERFPPRQARFIRFTIQATSGGEGCIDELEVYSADRNVALAGEGATATSSGDFVHPKHRLPHINDARYGNDHSWIVDSKEGGWVQIELAEPAVIDRIVWGRDRQGTYADRLPTSYRIEAAMEPEQWESLASSADRQMDDSDSTSMADYQFSNFPEADANQGKAWLERLQNARKEMEELATSTVVYAGTFSQPSPTHRLYRGEPDAPREQVDPGAIDAFVSLELKSDAPEQARRLALADWIASKENPLTARVIVNRLWQFHFGTGIVDTPSDFGRNGTPPSHPQLLDWLAGELVDHDWSLKSIHRLILHSQTWRQSNQPDPEAMRVDVDSRLLWRFPPRRLEAEAIRDSILAVAGVLDLQAAGGPGYSPFEVEMENVRHYYPKNAYGPEDWRRMIYMTKVRQEREHVFGVFDCPDASMVVPKRSRSTTPLQALNLLNSHFIVQQADLFAKRLKQDGATLSLRIERAWQLCFQRPPTDEELADSRQFIELEGLQQFTRAMLNTNEFVFIP